MKSICLFLLLVWFVTANSSGQVKLPRLISDGVVLQRDANVRIWGWASPGENITIQFIGSTYKTTADGNGEWNITLKDLKAGGSHKMQITSMNSITISDVMVGDVWVCSGQSNMELPMRRVSWVYPTEIANCTNPNIRQFVVPQKYDFKKPQADLSGENWKSANPQSVLSMIRDWRSNWQQGDFPFLFVQLANFMEPGNEPVESDWAMLREAQLKTLALPNTGMTVISDIGEWNDIHPVNKKDVGTRLALSAEEVAYNEKKIVYSGPIYQSMKIDGNKIVLFFSNIGSGLMAKGGTELKHFAIAGADKKFVWAKAKIEGNKVVVWSIQIPIPAAVRYAWADNPEGANLYNNEGLPASPFRTEL